MAGAYGWARSALAYSLCDSPGTVGEKSPLHSLTDPPRSPILNECNGLIREVTHVLSLTPYNSSQCHGLRAHERARSIRPTNAGSEESVLSRHLCGNPRIWSRYPRTLTWPKTLDYLFLRQLCGVDFCPEIAKSYSRGWLGFPPDEQRPAGSSFGRSVASNLVFSLGRVSVLSQNGAKLFTWLALNRHYAQNPALPLKACNGLLTSFNGD